MASIQDNIPEDPLVPPPNTNVPEDQHVTVLTPVVSNPSAAHTVVYRVDTTSSKSTSTSCGNKNQHQQTQGTFGYMAC